MDARKVFFTVVTLFVVVTSVVATNIPGGSYNASTAWPNGWTTGGSPYNINGDVTIIGGTLTIYPGVIVKFNSAGHYSLIIDGGATLNATGKADEDSLIIFSSNAEEPEAGDWKSIYFNTENNNSVATGTFSFCSFQYGGATDGGINKVFCAIDSTDLTIEHCEFVSDSGWVVWNTVTGGRATVVTFTDNVVYDCENGIYLMRNENGLGALSSICENTFIGGQTAIFFRASEIVQFAFEIQNNLLLNQTGISAYIYCGGAEGNDDIKFVNNTIVHSDTAVSLAGQNNNLDFRNNIVYDYSSYGLLAEVTLTVNNNDIYSSQGGASRISGGTIAEQDCMNSNPKLAVDNSSADDPEDLFDYHLLWDSPCLNAGDSTAAADTNRNGLRTDMGFYGGPNAPDDYYLAIRDTIPDEETFDNSYKTNFRVVDDVVILDGDSVYIGTSTDELRFEFLEDVTWTLKVNWLLMVMMPRTR